MTAGTEPLYRHQHDTDFDASGTHRPMRNLCGTGPKDPRQQSTKTQNRKIHDRRFSKHVKLLKNSS